MNIVRSLISAAGATASRMIGTNVHYPTNKASRTPLSSFLRCALSTTTPESETSGGSHLSTATTIKMMKVGDNPINIAPDIPSVIPSSSLPADSSTSASAKSSLNKPMDRDERLAYLEEMIKDAALMRLAEEIASATQMRDKLLEKEVLTTTETHRLKVIEEVDLPDMRKDRDRLAREIVELKAELSELKHPKELADAPVPEHGI